MHKEFAQVDVNRPERCNWNIFQMLEDEEEVNYYELTHVVIVQDETKVSKVIMQYRLLNNIRSIT